MKTAAFIPIKKNSERVKGKNFVPLAGKPLYEYIIDAAKAANVFDDVYIDTDSDEIREFAKQLGFKHIEREPWLASNEANGNDLLVSHAEKYPDYDLYFQLFATAPFLGASTIRACVQHLQQANDCDSILTVTRESGWFWFEGQPVNFRPGILPRSQDAQQVLKETTGLYGIKKESLLRYRSRIGAKPFFYLVDAVQALDLDTKDDFKIAEYFIKD